MNGEANVVSDQGRATPMPPLLAATLASGAFIVPLALSASSSPSPTHPGILLWYRLLRKPSFKPPDWAIPIAWIGIESALATAAYRLLRTPPSAPRGRALLLLSWNTFMIGAWSRLFLSIESSVSVPWLQLLPRGFARRRGHAALHTVCECGSTA